MSQVQTANEVSFLQLLMKQSVQTLLLFFYFFVFFSSLTFGGKKLTTREAWRETRKCFLFPSRFPSRGAGRQRWPSVLLGVAGVQVAQVGVDDVGGHALQEQPAEGQPACRGRGAGSGPAPGDGSALPSSPATGLPSPLFGSLPSSSASRSQSSWHPDRKANSRRTRGSVWPLPEPNLKSLKAGQRSHLVTPLELTPRSCLHSKVRAAD